MSPFFRRLVACLLFVLLPFQALATDTGACAKSMSDCAEMTEMMMHGDCCDDAHADDAPDGAHSCASEAGCMAAYAVAIPATVTLSAFASAVNDVGAGQSSSYRSFIPDTLQRPPCFFS